MRAETGLSGKRLIFMEKSPSRPFGGDGRWGRRLFRTLSRGLLPVEPLGGAARAAGEKNETENQPGPPRLLRQDIEMAYFSLSDFGWSVTVGPPGAMGPMLPGEGESPPGGGVKISRGNLERRAFARDPIGRARSPRGPIAEFGGCRRYVSGSTG